MKLIEEQTLVDCLDLLDAGESVEAVLARYPELTDALRPFLKAAVHVSQLAAQPTLAAKQKSQKRFLQRADEMRAATESPSPWLRLRQTLIPLASLAMVLLIVGVTFITTSTSAIPGDALYDAKLLLEDIRLTRTDNVESGEVVEEIQEERLREVEAVLRTDRDVSVAFEGVIRAFHANNWLVADIEVQVDRFTRIEGTPEIGSWAQVNGRTHDSILRAVSIIILPNDPLPVEPPETPNPTDSPTPTSTIEPSTPSAPTETPPPGDNTNDNSDDNVNENGDDNVNDNSDDNVNDNSDDNVNDNSDDNTNDNGDDNTNDNGDDNTNDNGDDNANDNGDDNTNDNGDDNANDNGDDNANDNVNGNGDDNGDDNANDNGNNNDDDDGNENDDDDDNSNNSGSGNGDGNDNGDSGNSGSGNGKENDNDNDNDDGS